MTLATGLLALPTFVLVLAKLAGVVLALSLGLLCLGCAVDKILFQPPPPSYIDAADILKVRTADSLLISAMHLPNADASFTLLCSHGNAEDIGQTRPLLEHMRDQGYSVFAYDYRGYGTSRGRPCEQGCYNDADAAYQYLREHLRVPPSRIIVFGRSLGGAMAIDLASRYPVAGLILDSAFLSAFSAVTRVPLPGDRFRNSDRMGRVHCPVLIMHGAADSVVPLWNGRKLYSIAHEPKLCLWVPDGGHNTLVADAGQAYWEKIAELTQLVRAQASQPADQ